MKIAMLALNYKDAQQIQVLLCLLKNNVLVPKRGNALFSDNPL
jgi:hypothetical protein